MVSPQFALTQLRQAVLGSKGQLTSINRESAVRVLVAVARGAQQTKTALSLATVLCERGSPTNVILMDLIATKIASSDDLPVFCSVCEALTKLARDPVCMVRCGTVAMHVQFSSAPNSLRLRLLRCGTLLYSGKSTSR